MRSRPTRGIEAEHNADDRRHCEPGEDDRLDRDRPPATPRRWRATTCATAQPSGDSHDAAHEREHDRLRQELEVMALSSAPSALRRPISRVRSVTVVSIMFMIPMPPTTSEMLATAASSGREHARHLGDRLEQVGHVLDTEVRERLVGDAVFGQQHLRHAASPPRPSARGRSTRSGCSTGSSVPETSAGGCESGQNAGIRRCVKPATRPSPRARLTTVSSMLPDADALAHRIDALAKQVLGEPATRARRPLRGIASSRRR